MVRKVLIELYKNFQERISNEFLNNRRNTINN